ncbi:hypothetical protein [Burkholderia sp. Se-20378]|uniref:hypothetical protein n=1 Tax=Burkholderia sp. Se-20378 TaxID=2703899 RepID=UPI00197F1E40|nr:hypothetical protein [Burkholderia sp. Se-20378]MBN3768926.1 hypothetical protein [Burkholderia sp. Se-20378]
MDKSGANPAAPQARSGQDISAVERTAFRKVRLSSIHEHYSNDRSWRRTRSVGIGVAADWQIPT